MFIGNNENKKRAKNFSLLRHFGMLWFLSVKRLSKLPVVCFLREGIFLKGLSHHIRNA
jgi:hypothetical protein